MKQEVLDACSEITQGYVEGLMQILLLEDTYNEVNYVKTAINGPNGEKYLVALLHVDGPVIELDKYRDKREDSEGSAK